MIEDNRESYEYVANFYYNDYKDSKIKCLSYSFLENDILVCYEGTFEALEIFLDKTEIVQYISLGKIHKFIAEPVLYQFQHKS